jgi:glycosyltransferase involved in cell wall biosynthesis
MKIALIDPSLFTWPYDKALVEGLRAEGHEAMLYTKHLAEKEPGKGAPYVREFFYPGFQSKMVKDLPHAVFLGLKGIAHFLGLIALFLELRNVKPDVIHFQWAPLPVIDRLFVRLFAKVAPVILTVHDSSPFNNNPKSKLQAMGAVDIMRDFDHLIVHTEAARNTLIRYGIQANGISRIAHGVLDSGSLRNVAPPANNNEEKPVTLLLFGHLKHYKGADLLIEAVGKMPTETRAKTRIHIAGKPQIETEPLFELAKKWNVENNITWDLRFIGEEEIDGMFAASDITVMPYREIDASGVLMVALSIGRPIVATRIGLFAELLEDGKHGFLTPMEDTDALAAAIAKLVENKSLRLEMGENVRVLGNSVPGWDEIARTTSELYREKIAAK